MNNNKSKISLGIFILIGYLALQFIFVGSTSGFNFIWVVVIIIAIPRLLKRFTDTNNQNSNNHSSPFSTSYRTSRKETAECEYCGNSNEVGREYCEHCGARILPY